MKYYMFQYKKDRKKQHRSRKWEKYNFDEVIDRHGTDCLKYDFGMKRKGRDDLLPLWVADMDFRLPDEILDEFHKRIDMGFLDIRIH